MHAVMLDFLIPAWIDWADSPDPGDAGAIPSGRSGLYRLVSAAVETRTLAAPVNEGMVLVFIHHTDGGSVAITVTGGVDDGGDTVMTFTDAGEWIALISMSYISSGSRVYRWRYLRNDGVTLS